MIFIKKIQGNNIVLCLPHLSCFFPQYQWSCHSFGSFPLLHHLGSFIVQISILASLSINNGGLFHFSLQTYHLLNLSLRATETFGQYVAFPQSGAGVFVQVGTPELVDYTVTGGKTCQEKNLFHFIFYVPRNQEGNDIKWKDSSRLIHCFFLSKLSNQGYGKDLLSDLTSWCFWQLKI